MFKSSALISGRPTNEVEGTFSDGQYWQHPKIEEPQRMAFEFEKSKLSAINPDNGATVSDSRTRWEIPGVSARVYREGRLSFEFFTVPIYKRVKLATKDGERERLVEVAMYIDRSSLRSNLRAALGALGRKPLSDADYNALLDSIKEGVYVQSTWGGWMLEQSPNYRVDFIESLENANAVLREGEERMG